jgi:hypothetical protein
VEWSLSGNAWYTTAYPDDADTWYKTPRPGWGNPRLATAGQETVQLTATTAAFISATGGVTYHLRIITKADYDAGYDNYAYLTNITLPAAATAPGIPSNFSAARVAGTNTVRVEWGDVSGANGATSYELWYKKTSEGEDAWVKETIYPHETFTAQTTRIYCTTPDLDQGATYEFQVRAVNAMGESGWATSVSVALALPQLSVTGFNLANKEKAGSTWTVELDWNAVEGATSYVVEYVKGIFRPNDTNNTWHLDDWAGGTEIPAESNFIEINGLDDGETYWFRVKAIGVEDVSRDSNWVILPAAAVIMADKVVVAPEITNFNVVNTSQSAMYMTWDWVPGTPDPNMILSDPQPALFNNYFELQYSTNGESWLTIPVGGSGIRMQGNNNGGNTTSISTNVIGLANNTEYHFRLRVLETPNTVGSDYAYLTARTNANNAAPAIPGGLAAGNDTTTSVALTWNAVTGDNGASRGYEVQYKRTSEGDEAWITWTVSGETIIKENRVTITGLAAGEEYEFQVRALNTTGGGDNHGGTTDRQSDWSDSVTKTPDSGQFSAPGGFRFESKEKVGSAWTINLAWNAVADAVGYHVEWVANATMPTATDWDTPDGFVKVPVNENFAEISYLDDGETYWFRVKTLGGDGIVMRTDSNWSNLSTPVETTIVTQFPTITNFKAEKVSNSAILLTWDAVPGVHEFGPGPVATFNAYFVVQWSTDGNTWKTLPVGDNSSPRIQSAGSWLTSTSANVINVTADTEYYFRIITKDTANNAAADEYAYAEEGTTIKTNRAATNSNPATPSGLGGSIAGAGAVALTWTPTSNTNNPITGYEIQYRTAEIGKEGESGYVAPGEWTTWIVSGTDTLITTSNVTITGLVDGVKYDFQVRSVGTYYRGNNHDLAGNWSGSYAIVTGAEATYILELELNPTFTGDKATLAQVDRENASVRLTWNTSTTEGITYQIIVKNAIGIEIARLTTLDARNSVPQPQSGPGGSMNGTDATEFTMRGDIFYTNFAVNDGTATIQINGLDPGATYGFEVVAIKNEGELTEDVWGIAGSVEGVEMPEPAELFTESFTASYAWIGDDTWGYAVLLSWEPVYVTDGVEADYRVWWTVVSDDGEGIPAPPDWFYLDGSARSSSDGGDASTSWSRGYGGGWNRLNINKNHNAPSYAGNAGNADANGGDGQNGNQNNTSGYTLHLRYTLPSGGLPSGATAGASVGDMYYIMIVATNGNTAIGPVALVAIPTVDPN